VIAAVGNGDGQDNASYQGDRRKLFQGRSLVVIRASQHSGAIKLTAKAPGLHAGSVIIQSKPSRSQPELQ
jgi:beta-galactosidase